MQVLHHFVLSSLASPRETLTTGTLPGILQFFSSVVCPMDGLDAKKDQTKLFFHLNKQNHRSKTYNLRKNYLRYHTKYFVYKPCYPIPIRLIPL